MLNNVPTASQTLASSQSLIQANFATIDTAFTVNHVSYNDGSGNQGKHAFIQFPVQALAPVAAPGDISLYNQNSSLTGLNELYIVKADATTKTPMTASHQAPTGWTYLPSGVLMKWGTTSTISSSEPFSYTFPVSSSTPVFTTIFTVMLTTSDSNPPFSGAVAVQTSSLSTTGFSVIYNGTASGTTVVNYLAIGN
jgi:hypothetical protein